MIHGIDWFGTFLPATLCLFKGCSVDSFFNPSWTLFPLIPFVLLGKEGVYLLWFAQLATFLSVGLKYGNKLTAVLFVLSPFSLGSMAIGNVEWLVLLGFLMDNGLPMLLIKPQMTIVHVANKVLKDRRAILPVLLLTLFSVDSIVHMLTYSTNHVQAVNRSLFPYGIPIALGIICLVYKKRIREDWLIAATPFLMPYITLCSWIVVLIPLLKYPKIFVPLIPALWFFVLKI